VIGGALHPQLDPPAIGRELDRVREQVPHDLLQTRRVAEDQFRQAPEIGDKRDALALHRDVLVLHDSGAPSQFVHIHEGSERRPSLVHNARPDVIFSIENLF